MSLRKPILVVEDSSTQAVALETLLENSGYGVTVAGSGEAALASIRAHSVALVLTDLVMPGIDGSELCR
ncbi:MAG: response regulator, partial [Gemmatimonadaceae bacterium]